MRTFIRILALPLFLGIILCFARSGEVFNYPPIPEIQTPYINSLEELPTFVVSDIPGLSPNEIQAINDLRQRGTPIRYVMPPGIEAFYLDNGEVSGVSSLLASWLSLIFELDIRVEILPWERLLPTLRDKTSSITSALPDTPEWRREFYMTPPVTVRPIKVYRRDSQSPLNRLGGDFPRFAFIEGTAHQESVRAALRRVFVTVWVKDHDIAFELLEKGEVDAFFDEGPEIPITISPYGPVTSENVFPLLYQPVGLSTSTSDPLVIPFLGAVEKAMRSKVFLEGLTLLYNRGCHDYIRRFLELQFNEEEKAYIRKHREEADAIRFAAKHDKYPVSFYDADLGSWRGIAFDVLAEISTLTGLKFSQPDEKPQSWVDISDKLLAGELSLVAEIAHTQEPDSTFIWPTTAFHVDNLAMISLVTFPEITMEDVAKWRVGLLDRSVYTALFDNWFPEHTRNFRYRNWSDALLAMENGEIDLLMAPKNIFAEIANLLDHPIYKTNLVFNQPVESSLGLAHQETVLKSILDKTLHLVNIPSFVDYWFNRVSDYNQKSIRSNIPWLVGGMVLLACILTMLFIMLIRKREAGLRLSDIVNKRTLELETQTHTLEDALQQAQGAARAKSEFLARMSHEIRTPMNAVIGGMEFILRRDLPRDILDDATNIKQAGESLLAIINDILDFSKIESGKMELIDNSYDLPSLLTSVISFARMSLSEKPVTFLVDIDNRLPRTLIGDELRLRQVILNVLVNAIRYTPEGHILFMVMRDEADDVPEQTIKIRFTVSDTGIGIRDSDTELLFHDFTRGLGNKYDAGHGTGLGLTISRHLSRAMGGDIGVSSSFGMGSTFTVILPQRIVDDSPLASVESPADKLVLIYEKRPPVGHSISCALDRLEVKNKLVDNFEDLCQEFANARYTFIFSPTEGFDQVLDLLGTDHPWVTPVILANYSENIPSGFRYIPLPAHVLTLADVINGLDVGDDYSERDKQRIHFTAPSAKVLVVDDITTNLRVTKLLLEPYEMRVDCVKSGQKAISMVSEHQYDLVFMDHLMPEMDGVEAVRLIRGQDGAYFKALPIIALTASSDSGAKEMFISNGFSDFLSKPIEASLLDGILERWLPIEKRVKTRHTDMHRSIIRISGMTITGLDIRMGMANFGNFEKGYLEVLELYCRDVYASLGELRRPQGRDDLLELTARLHSLRSSNANIGAMELAEQAARLEQAGKDSDLRFFDEELANFRHELFAMAERIHTTLEKYGITTGTVLLPPPERHPTA
ncbi:MAG: response regulator [Planctomycetota bacterium]|jgi:signal transduction histidine kinase/CheY-like chemotaxis protein/HPt (histidine-containing phosphotransfer) domain-containing protein|nr:response regulator [Planctomycetota bacterium]